jgi:hypothetical protein
MSRDRRKSSKPLEIVSGVSGCGPETRHSKSPVVSPDSAPCVGLSSQTRVAAPQAKKFSRRAQTLRAALHAAVEAFCDAMDAGEAPRRPSARPVVVDENAPPRASDNAAAKSALKRMGLG